MGELRSALVSLGPPPPVTLKAMGSCAKSREAQVRELQAISSGGDHTDIVQAVQEHRTCDGVHGGPWAPPSMTAVS